VDEALTVFSLTPDWDLEIMKEGQSPTEVGRACLVGVQRVVSEWRPDLLLVQGDTASVFFASLTAFLHGIPCGHVEAGLRSGDMRRPFPEEGFRRLTSVLADLNFAPTRRAGENLLREGVSAERIEVTGNTIVDALLEIASRETAAASPVLARLLAPGARTSSFSPRIDENPLEPRSRGCSAQCGG
jgi:UDP-N-acetylglucosamine 2-epimerase (non-hydrolysing)